MTLDLNKALMISAAGMTAQSNRVRVIAENVANADSTGEFPGADAYRRKMVVFKNALDRELGVNTVTVSKVSVDRSPQRLKYDPAHPAADKAGYVKMPNVTAMIEAMDMRQAQRSYEANVTMIDGTKGMLQRTIDLLRS